MATKNPGEGQFLFDAQRIASLDAVELIHTGASPSWFEDAQWQRWWQQLHSPRIDAYVLRFSPRANRTKALLDEAKAGLLFGDVTRYGQIVRVREILLRGSHMQPLPDRGAFAWSLFACPGVGDTVVKACVDQLPTLVPPKDIGRYLEASDLLNRQPFNKWAFYEYLRIAYGYAVEHGQIAYWTPPSMFRPLTRCTRQFRSWTRFKGPSFGGPT